MWFLLVFYFLDTEVSLKQLCYVSSGLMRQWPRQGLAFIVDIWPPKNNISGNIPKYKSSTTLQKPNFPKNQPDSLTVPGCLSLMFQTSASLMVPGYLSLTVQPRSMMTEPNFPKISQLIGYRISKPSYPKNTASSAVPGYLVLIFQNSASPKVWG
jgi:hypothetical protein